MEISPLSRDMCLKGGFLPLPYGTPVFSNEFLLVIDPDLLIRCLNSYLLSYVADRDAVERTIVLDMEVSPNSSILLVIGLILQYRKWQKGLFFFCFNSWSNPCCFWR